MKNITSLATALVILMTVSCTRFYHINEPSVLTVTSKDSVIFTQQVNGKFAVCTRYLKKPYHITVTQE